MDMLKQTDIISCIINLKKNQIINIDNLSYKYKNDFLYKKINNIF